MDNELYHYGIPGMKWGVRKKTYSNSEISNYRKKKIAEAPTKEESPRGANKGWYKNAPKTTIVREMKREEASMLKSEAKLNKVGKKANKRINAIQKDIDSFKGYENGIYAKNGKMLVSKTDVQQSVKALSDLQAKDAKKVTDMVKELSKKYNVVYDVASESYKLRYKH